MWQLLVVSSELRPIYRRTVIRAVAGLGGPIELTGGRPGRRHSPPGSGGSPRAWRHWSPAQKIEHGMSLDRAHEILSWRVGELDSQRLNVLTQVLRIILMIGLKALLDGKLGRDAARERDRQRILEELARKEIRRQ